MTTIIHAIHETALRNGSYYRQAIGKRNSTVSHYMNGDFMGWTQTLPPGLKTWSIKDARKLMPKPR